MITCYLQTSANKLEVGSEALIETWQHDTRSYIWLDLQYEALDAAEIKTLLARFECNPMAVKDVLRERHPSKTALFKQQIFMLYRGITDVVSCIEFKHQQIGFFIGQRFLITVHPSSSMGINAILEKTSFLSLLAQPFHLALHILHASSDTYLENLIEFEDILGEQEDAIQHGEGELRLTELAAHRVKLLRLKRIFNDHRQVLRDLIDAKTHGLIEDKEHDHLLSDVYGRFDRLNSLANLYYDLCSDMIEGYISISTHQQNVSMRVLTVIMSIFIPLSFLAGVYGMNFDSIPELHHPYGYPILLSIMFIVATTLIVIFKRKKWF